MENQNNMQQEEKQKKMPEDHRGAEADAVQSNQGVQGSQGNQDTQSTAPESIPKEAATGPENANKSANTNNGVSKEKNVSIEEALAKIEELQDSWVRERAEFMNFRKRAVQDRKKQIENTAAGFLHDLLPALDGLDQILNMQTESPEGKKYREGVSMIRESFVKVLNEKNIRVLYPLNEEFDPLTMEAIAVEAIPAEAIPIEAVSSEEKSELSKDKVLEVFQPGYFQEGDEGNRKLIRAARVRVGKVPAQADKAN